MSTVNHFMSQIIKKKIIEIVLNSEFFSEPIGSLSTEKKGNIYLRDHLLGIVCKI